MWEAFFVCTGVRFGGFFAETSPCALAGAQPSTGRLGGLQATWALRKTSTVLECRGTHFLALTKVRHCCPSTWLGCANAERGLFSSPLASCMQLSQFTRKGASNDKVFRTLRRATKGFAFGNHSLLKKAGENFILQKLGAAR